MKPVYKDHLRGQKQNICGVPSFEKFQGDTLEVCKKIKIKKKLLRHVRSYKNELFFKYMKNMDIYLIIEVLLSISYVKRVKKQTCISLPETSLYPICFFNLILK